MPSIAGVLLAAGSSTRFGASDKLLSVIGGRPLVLHALDALLSARLSAGLSEVIVVTGASSDVSSEIVALMGDGVTVARNADAAQGIASSLALAVQVADAAGYDALVVGLGDQPGIPAAAWRAVAHAAGGPIVVATYDGVRANPVRLDRAVWPMLPTTGDEGARRLMGERPHLVTEIACQGDPSDIDSEEDLRRWN